MNVSRLALNYIIEFVNYNLNILRELQVRQITENQGSHETTDRLHGQCHGGVILL